MANGTVYVGTWSTIESVIALDAATGTEVWSFATGDFINSSPAVANGVVYVDGPGVYALDASTGAKLWGFTGAGYVASSPVVADGAVFVASLNRKVYSFTL